MCVERHTIPLPYLMTHIWFQYWLGDDVDGCYQDGHDATEFQRVHPLHCVLNHRVRPAHSCIGSVNSHLPSITQRSCQELSNFNFPALDHTDTSIAPHKLRRSTSKSHNHRQCPSAQQKPTTTTTASWRTHPCTTGARARSPDPPQLDSSPRTLLAPCVFPFVVLFRARNIC